MKCKTVREDVIREEEFEDVLRKLDSKEMIKGTYECMLHGKPIVQKFNIYCKRTQCLLSLLWIFGKRISEILLLKQRDVWVEDDFLYARFTVKKKSILKVYRRGRKFVKRITLENKYAKYVVSYVETLSDQDSYLFPGDSRARTYKTHARTIYGMKDYTYTRKESGFMSSAHAWKIVKYLNGKLYLHLFRDSLATLMAEHDFTEDQLMAWFDWDSSKVAHGYVKRGTKLSEKASMRKW